MIPSSDCRLWPSDQSGPTPEIVVVSPRQLHLPQGHDLNGKRHEERLAVRRAVSRPLVDDLMTTMRGAGGQAWLADVLSRIASHLTHRLDELLPWNWRPRLRPSRRSRPDPCT
jgi:hypothetical protein